MIPKPKYLENVLEITRYKNNWISCNVICECGSNHFEGYKNLLIKTKEQKNTKKSRSILWKI